MSFAASAVVRTYNSAGTLEATLASLLAQDVPVEIVVVDSGSTDRTSEIAGQHAHKVISIPQSEFSYGRALNLGAGASTAPVHVALSSHCVLPRADWVRIACEHVSAGAAAVVGMPTDAEGNALQAPFRASHSYLLDHKHWGFSNHASAWSAQVWERHPFDEELTATEDKEWTWRALADSGPLVVDPRLLVEGTHRRSAGVRSYYRRMVKEIAALEELDPLPPFGVGDALSEWVRLRPRDPFLTAARRCGRTRAVEVAARYSAGRLARSARPGGHPAPQSEVPR